MSTILHCTLWVATSFLLFWVGFAILLLVIDRDGRHSNPLFRIWFAIKVVIACTLVGVLQLFYTDPEDNKHDEHP